MTDKIIVEYDADHREMDFGKYLEACHSEIENVEMVQSDE